MRSCQQIRAARAIAVSVLAAAAAVLTGCQKEAPPEPPKPKAISYAPKPEAPPPPAAAGADGGGADGGMARKTKMVAPTDGLSLADRMAKRQADEKKLAAELATAEKERLLKHDRTKLPLHTSTFAFIKKTRQQYDDLEKKLPPDKEKAKVAIDKLRESLQTPIKAQAKKMVAIDPTGGNSNVTTDYDVMMNALANDYPLALAASVDGDKAALTEQRTELDRRTKKIDEWLAELKASKGKK